MDRCVRVEMNAAGVVFNDTQLQHLVSALNGSLRNVIANAARWARRRAVVAGRVAVRNAQSPRSLSQGRALMERGLSG